MCELLAERLTMHLKPSAHRRTLALFLTLVFSLCIAGSAQATADPYLRLINWSNTYEGDEYTLVKLNSVFDKGLVLMKSGKMVEQTAGAAANEMFRAAKEQGVGKFYILSAYRSVKEQQGLWQRKLRRNPSYGQDPFHEPVSVMPGGTSEHAAGLALDILSKSHRKSDAAYGDTREGKWLATNAYQYGFILRYPDGKQHITGVIYEPWHFRYVGKEAAKEMFEQNLCLEEYLQKKQAERPSTSAFPTNRNVG